MARTRNLAGVPANICHGIISTETTGASGGAPGGWRLRADVSLDCFSIDRFTGSGPVLDYCLAGRRDGLFERVATECAQLGIHAWPISLVVGGGHFMVRRGGGMDRVTSGRVDSRVFMDWVDRLLGDVQ